MPMFPPAHRPWPLTAAVGWGAASCAGWVEVVHVVASGPVAPGPVAALVLLALALIWPGVAGALAALVLRRVGRRDAGAAFAVGLAVGGIIVAVGHPIGALVPLTMSPVALWLPGRWRVVGALGLVAAGGLVATRPGVGRSVPEGPDILLITVAGVPVDPGAVELPGLEVVARHGIRFDAAMLPTDALGPNLTALATGAAPWRTGVLWDGDRLPADVATLAERLRAAGWTTAAWVPDEALAIAPGVGRGFDVLDTEGTWLVGASTTAAGRLFVREWPQRADIAADRASRWIARQRRPWFVWVHLHDARRALAPPPPYDERYRHGEEATRVTPPAWTGLPPDASEADVRAAALGTVAWADAQVPRILDAVDPRRAVVAWVGASTARLGEDGRWLVPDASPADWRVPMAVAVPDVPSGVVDVPVEVADLPETLASVAGIESDERRSLRDAIERGEVRRSAARSVGYADGWVASVASRYGRATAGARSQWRPAMTRPAVFVPDPSAPADEDPIRRLLQARAEALVAEVLAAPRPASAGDLGASGGRQRP